MTLLRLVGGADGARSCLGFVKRVDEPDLPISGWSCQGDTLPARRAAISCMLNRLILLSTGNDPKLAELFARAELRRGSCASATSAVVGGLGDDGAKPPLRGACLIAFSRVRGQQDQDTGFHETFSLRAGIILVPVWRN